MSQSLGWAEDEYANGHWEETQSAERALTDEDGFYRGQPGHAVEHVTDEKVPDNAHWKGWVW